MEWGTIAQWVSAAITLVAVLVALFKEELVRLWRCPSLGISGIEARDRHKLPIVYQIQRTAPTLVTEGYFFRFWVENSGKARADHVQVFASKLLRRAVDGTFQEDSRFLPMNLLWAHDDKVYAEGISPKMGKHCNLGRIVRPNERVELGDDLTGLSATSTVFALSLEVSPSSQAHLLPPNTYRLEVRIAAANSAPVTKTLEITHTGTWFDDPDEMYQSGIGLKVI